MGILVFLLILMMVAVAAYYIITYFKLPQPVMIIVGFALLIALLIYVFSGVGGPAVVRIP